MGVPPSEVGYTLVTTGRGDHEVYMDIWWHWRRKKKRKNVHYCHLSFLYTNKGEERENRVTIYSCCYHYCLIIQDQSVIVRRSVYSFNSITLLSLSSSCLCYSRYMQLYSITACMSDLRVQMTFILRENTKWINHESCFFCVCGVMYLLMISIIRDYPPTQRLSHCGSI